MAEVKGELDGSTPSWDTDESTTCCTGCASKFTMMRRRHHCRACGRIYCQTCSNHKDVLPAHYQLDGPQRTCDACHLHLQQLKVAANPDDHPPRPDPSEVRTELLTRIQGLLDEPEDNWVCKVNRKGVKIDILKVKDSNLVCVRSQFQARVPLWKATTVYNDKSAWKIWQPELLKCQTLEKIAEDEEFMYVLYNVPIMDNRDVVAYSYLAQGSVQNPSCDKSCSLLSTSVEHPLAPRKHGFVRAHLNIGYTLFAETESEDGASVTTMTSMFHTDPRGMIPPSLVNSTITRVSSQLRDMIKYMESCTLDEPDRFPGQRNTIHVTSAASAPATTAPAESSTVIVV
eukprot:m.108337 g.108337  ORF g.108337 m.108337 type:complete len:343 (-) comp13344_c0_seq1:32-1060(-)